MQLVVECERPAANQTVPSVTLEARLALLCTRHMFLGDTEARFGTNRQQQLE